MAPHHRNLQLISFQPSAQPWWARRRQLPSPGLAASTVKSRPIRQGPASASRRRWRWTQRSQMQVPTASLSANMSLVLLRSSAASVTTRAHLRMYHSQLLTPCIASGLDRVLAARLAWFQADAYRACKAWRNQGASACCLEEQGGVLCYRRQRAVRDVDGGGLSRYGARAGAGGQRALAQVVAPLIRSANEDQRCLCC